MDVSTFALMTLGWTIIIAVAGPIVIFVALTLYALIKPLVEPYYYAWLD